MEPFCQPTRLRMPCPFSHMLGCPQRLYTNWEIPTGRHCTPSRIFSKLWDFADRAVRMSVTRLDLRSAAVNEQLDTRDETGVIRRQKQHHLSNFLGFPHA